MYEMYDKNLPCYSSNVYPPKPYRIETLSVRDGDVIILHLADNLDFDDIITIQRDIQKDFPNNKVICANDHILKSITVLQKTDTENVFGVDLSLDGEWMF